MKLSYFKIFLAFSVILSLVLVSAPVFAVSEDSPEVVNLRKNIEDKTSALQEVNKQIQKTQENISKLEQQGQSLNKAIKQSDYQINQLSLTIRSSEIKIDKLGSEIELLSFDISAKEEEMARKREAVVNFLRELQERDHDNNLTIFLRNVSLAESVFEVQSLTNINEGLSKEISDLEDARTALADSLSLTNKKKQDVEQETRGLKYKQDLVVDQKTEHKQLLSLTKSQEQQYQSQLKELAEQQEAIAKEIEAYEKELRSKIDTDLLPIPRPGVLLWPVNGGILSQGYGQTAFALQTYKGHWHNGIDIAAPLGTDIYAAEAGEVIFATNQDAYCPRGAYGKVIVVKHNNGLTTLYGHLSQYLVTVGQKVERGQLIARMGKTGWATGSHIHFTVWETSTYLVKGTRVCGPMPVGGDVNPLEYVSRPL